MDFRKEAEKIYIKCREHQYSYLLEIEKSLRRCWNKALKESLNVHWFVKRKGFKNVMGHNRHAKKAILSFKSGAGKDE